MTSPAANQEQIRADKIAALKKRLANDRDISWGDARWLLAELEHVTKERDEARDEADAARQEAHRLDEAIVDLEAARLPSETFRQINEARAVNAQLVSALAAAEQRAATLEEALDAIAQNAESWHVDAEAKQRALNVIATWARRPTEIPPQVFAASPKGNE